MDPTIQNRVVITIEGREQLRIAIEEYKASKAPKPSSPIDKDTRFSFSTVITKKISQKDSINELELMSSIMNNPFISTKKDITVLLKRALSKEIVSKKSPKKNIPHGSLIDKS